MTVIVDRKPGASGRPHRPLPLSLACAAATALSVLALQACRDRGRQATATVPRVQVSSLEAELTRRGGEEHEGPGLEVDAMARRALEGATVLELAPGRPAGGRLRLRATLSVDGRTGELHAMVSARLDHASTLPLEWAVDRLAPAPAGPGAEREALERALGEAVRALDLQAAVVGLGPAELVSALGSEEAPARFAAARALGRSRAAAAVEPLCGLLSDGHEPVAREAARSLALIRDQGAVPCLLRWGGAEPERMALVVEALAGMQGEVAREALEGLARDAGTGEVRRLAASRLARPGRGHGHEHDHDHGEEEHGTERASSPVVQAYLDALSDPDRRVRIGATSALGELRSAEAIEPLCSLLDRDDPEESLAALDALTQIQNETAIPCLVRWGAVDERRLLLVVPSLVAIGGSQARGVLQMLAREDRQDSVRRLAEAGLRDLRSRESAPRR